MRQEDQKFEVLKIVKRIVKTYQLSGYYGGELHEK